MSNSENPKDKSPACDFNPEDVDERKLMPFLEMASKGCISGRFIEWPQLVPAIKWALEKIKAPACCGKLKGALREADIFMRGMAKLHPENMTEVAKAQMDQVQQVLSSSCSCECGKEIERLKAEVLRLKKWEDSHVELTERYDENYEYSKKLKAECGKLKEELSKANHDFSEARTTANLYYQNIQVKEKIITSLEAECARLRELKDDFKSEIERLQKENNERFDLLIELQKRITDLTHPQEPKE